jgi:hypothetical protein
MLSMLLSEVGVDREVLALNSAARDLEGLEDAGHRVVRVLADDADRDRLLGSLDAASFDVAVLDRTLETATDPLAVLARVLPLLRPGGRLLVTADNVLHGGRRLGLLTGVWTPSVGAAADGALRHLDPESLIALLHAAGCFVDTLRATVVDPAAAGPMPPRGIPADVVEWLRDQPGAFDKELLAIAVPGAPTREAPSVEIDRVVDPATVRQRDRHTRAALSHGRELQDLRHRLLTLRDHVIGLEAETVAARHRQQVAEVRATRATARAERLKARVLKAERRARRAETKLAAAQKMMRRSRRELQTQVAELRSSRSYRTGRALAAPLRFFRRG